MASIGRAQAPVAGEKPSERRATFERQLQQVTTDLDGVMGYAIPPPPRSAAPAS